jgi:hypothetical protein
MVDRRSTADEQLARHLATAKRQMQARGQTRDDMGRITAPQESPLAEWAEPKRQYGEVARYSGGGRMRMRSFALPVRADAALRNIADQRGVSVSFILCEKVAELLAPLIEAPIRGLTDAQIPFRQPDKVHSPEPPQLKRRGYLTDRR